MFNFFAKVALCILGLLVGVPVLVIGSVIYIIEEVWIAIICTFSFSIVYVQACWEEPTPKTLPTIFRVVFSVAFDMMRGKDLDLKNISFELDKK